MASSNFSTRFNFWTKERIGGEVPEVFPKQRYWLFSSSLLAGLSVSGLHSQFVHLYLCVCICVFALLIIPPSLLAGLSASAIHSVFTKDLSVGTLDPFVQRDPNERQPLKIQVSFHIVHFSDFSLSLKRKKVNIFQLELPLHWFGGFSAKSHNSKFLLAANCSSLAKSKKIYFGYNSFSG